MRSLVIFFLIVAFTANANGLAHFVKADCPKTCYMDYTPICAARFGGKANSVCTFINLCTLELYICHTDQEWHIESNEPCQWPSNDCEDILMFFRTNKQLFLLDK